MNDSWDKSIRAALQKPVEPSEGFEVKLFASAHDLLAQRRELLSEKAVASKRLTLQAENVATAPMRLFKTVALSPAAQAVALLLLVSAAVLVGDLNGGDSETVSGRSISRLREFPKNNDAPARYDAQYEAERQAYEREVQNAKKKPVAESELRMPVRFRNIAVMWVLSISLLAVQVGAAERNFLRKEADGKVAPFKVTELPLAEFVRQYAAFTGTAIDGGDFGAQGPKGSVSLYLRRALSQQDLEEIFHQVLDDHGYAVVDAPAKLGWILLRGRNARDAPLPVYDSAQVPSTHRMVTVAYTLKYAPADEVARNIRSYMSANSRIIPATPSQLLITTDGKNARKVLKIIALQDTPEAAKRPRRRVRQDEMQPMSPPKEVKIDQLTVERLEVKNSGTEVRGKK